MAPTEGRVSERVFGHRDDGVQPLDVGTADPAAALTPLEQHQQARLVLSDQTEVVGDRLVVLLGLALDGRVGSSHPDQNGQHHEIGVGDVLRQPRVLGIRRGRGPSR